MERRARRGRRGAVRQQPNLWYLAVATLCGALAGACWNAGSRVAFYGFMAGAAVWGSLFLGTEVRDGDA